MSLAVLSIDFDDVPEILVTTISAKKALLAQSMRRTNQRKYKLHRKTIQRGKKMIKKWRVKLMVFFVFHGVSQYFLFGSGPKARFTIFITFFPPGKKKWRGKKNDKKMVFPFFCQLRYSSSSSSIYVYMGSGH